MRTKTFDVTIPVPSVPTFDRTRNFIHNRKMQHEVRKLVKLSEELEDYPLLRNFWDACCIQQRFSIGDYSYAARVADERVLEETKLCLEVLETTKDKKFGKLFVKLLAMAEKEDEARYARYPEHV